MATTRRTLLTTLACGLACGDDVSPRDVPRKDDPSDVRARDAKDGPAHRDAPRAPGSGAGDKTKDPVAPARIDPVRVDKKNDDIDDDDDADPPIDGAEPRAPGAGAPTR
jgi:hypothetical protein